MKSVRRMRLPLAGGIREINKDHLASANYMAGRIAQRLQGNKVLFFLFTCVYTILTVSSLTDPLGGEFLHQDATTSLMHGNHFFQDK